LNDKKTAVKNLEKGRYGFSQGFPGKRKRSRGKAKIEVSERSLIAAAFQKLNTIKAK
jgi:hypothetical protein